MDTNDPVDAPPTGVRLSAVALPLPPLPPLTWPAMAADHAFAVLPYYGYFPPVGPPKPRVWPVFVGLLIAFGIGQFVSVLVLFGFMAMMHTEAFSSADAFRSSIMEAMQAPPVLLPALAANQFALLGAAMLGGVLSPLGLKRRLRLGRSTVPWYGYPIVAVGALAVGVLFSALIDLLGIKAGGAMKEMSDVIHRLSRGEITAAIVIIGVMPGFAEEWLFRGYTQTRLSRRWGRWPAIVITAILFGIFHLDLVQGMFAMSFGIYVGYLAERCGSVRPGMIAHMTNNSFMVLVGALASSEGESSVRAMSWIAGISGAVLTLSILYIALAVPRAAVPDPTTAGEAAPIPIPIALAATC